MGIHELLQWWNLIYAAPLVISIAWILTTVFSGMSGHGGHEGHGHDFGHGGHHDLHVGHGGGDHVHDAHIGHGDGAHAHAHHAHTHQGHGHHGADEDAPSRIIMLLGLGEVPITLLIGIFLLCWGAIGILCNQVFEAIMRFPLIYIWPSMGVTFIVSFAVTRSMAAIVGRLIPGEETYGVGRLELIGHPGRAIYSTGETTGTVDIKDKFGTVHRVQAKTEAGQEPIAAGADVIVVDFDDADKRFIVRQGSI